MGIFKKRPQKDKDCGDELVKSPVSKEAINQIRKQKPTIKVVFKEEDKKDEKDKKDESHS